MRAAQLGHRPTEAVLPSGQTRWNLAQAARLWDAHGAAVYALACALLGDEVAAKRAVVLAVTDLVDSRLESSGDDSRRSLARHVYLRCADLAGEAPDFTGLPPAMAWIGRLARLQRACLALCMFGGHTSRDAAELLGLPPLEVARMLRSALDEFRASAHPASVQ